MLIQARPYDGRIIQLCWIQRSFDVRETVGLSWIFHLWVGHRLFHLVMGEIGKSWQIIMLKIHLFLLAMVYIWAISKNPRFTERTSTNLERCNRLPHVCTIMIYGYIWQTWGDRLQKKEMIYLIPKRRLCFLFDQASSLQDSELSEEVLLENVPCKSFFFPPASMDSQLVGQPPLHSHSPALRAYKPECYGAYLLSAPLRARTFASLSIYLGVVLNSGSVVDNVFRPPWPPLARPRFQSTCAYRLIYFHHHHHHHDVYVYIYILLTFSSGDKTHDSCQHNEPSTWYLAPREEEKSGNVVYRWTRDQMDSCLEDLVQTCFGPVSDFWTKFEPAGVWGPLWIKDENAADEINISTAAHSLFQQLRSRTIYGSSRKHDQTCHASVRRL